MAGQQGPETHQAGVEPYGQRVPVYEDASVTATALIDGFGKLHSDDIAMLRGVLKTYCCQFRAPEGR